MRSLVSRLARRWAGGADEPAAGEFLAGDAQRVRALEAHDIAKAYGGRQVVRGVSLRITQGEVVGLLGPNGAGKTTCFYMMVGLVRADAGSIVADGSDITRLPMYLRAREHGISYLPQEPSIFRKLSVEENILAVLEAQQLELGDTTHSHGAFDRAA